MKSKFLGLWPAVVIFVIAMAAIGLLDAVWRSPHQGQLAVFGAVAVPVITAAAAAARIVWQWRAKAAPTRPAVAAQELDDLTELLAAAAKGQWTKAADERGLLTPEPIPVRWRRPSLPLVGPALAAVGSRRFDPLPGLAVVGDRDLMAGDIGDLVAIYGGLGSGRLVIAGAPGTGKSGTAVLLLLAVLKHRDQTEDAERFRIPIPVLFTAQEWDPVSQRVHDWLARRMRETYPLFAGKAGLDNAVQLIAAGRIMVILDGLDEIAEELRPVALQALSQQAAFRLVVLSRTAEMASAAAQRGLLEGAAAIELQAIDAPTAADYLSRVQLDPPPEGWRDLTNRILAAGGPLARALDSPLTLTLVRDTYRAGDDVRELLNFCDSAQRRVSNDRLTKEITGHLLDRVLPAAYARTVGEKKPPYDLDTAQHALAMIAAHMSQDGTRDLQWWRLSGWAEVRPRRIAGGLAAGLAAGLAVALVVGLVAGPAGGLAAGLVVGLVVGGTAGAAAGNTDAPRRIGKFQPRKTLTRSNLVSGLTLGLTAGSLFGLTAGLAAGLAAGFVGGFVTMLVFGPAVVLVFGLEDLLSDRENTTSESPLTSWRSDLGYGLVEMLAVGLVFGSVFGLTFGLWVGAPVGAAAGAAAGLMFGLIDLFGESRTWTVSLVSFQLTRRWHTPARLMRFLDDARERSILRTVGPIYQFRHARLQDRLAGSDQNSDTKAD